MTIAFADNGQDFLEWDVDDKTGVVVDCRPFQGWVWIGCVVCNAKTIKVGDAVHVTMPNSERVITLKHQALNVRRRAA